MINRPMEHAQGLPTKNLVLPDVSLADIVSHEVSVTYR